MEFETLTRNLEPLVRVQESGILTSSDPARRRPHELQDFIRDIGAFVREAPQYGLADYRGVLADYGWGGDPSWDALAEQDPQTIDAKLALAALVWISRSDYWSPVGGEIARAVQEGKIQRLLARLRYLEKPGR